MNPPKRKKAPGQGKTMPTPTPKLSLRPWIVLALAIVLIGGFLLWKQGNSSHGENVPPTSSAQPTESPIAPGSPPQSPVEFQKLKGKWLRPDGGYVIEIKDVEEGGKLGAAYFNPQPINVSKAQASQEGSTTKVFIELRDVNYPGSTYTLTYLPGKDLLVGIYYQALQQQSYEVYFERTK